jgi:menaquinone-dependent protoporphyrinogen IX oxidase
LKEKIPGQSRGGRDPNRRYGEGQEQEPQPTQDQDTIPDPIQGSFQKPLAKPIPQQVENLQEKAIRPFVVQVTLQKQVKVPEPEEKVQVQIRKSIEKEEIKV